MELWKLTAGQASRRIAEGSLSAEDYARAFLERIAARLLLCHQAEQAIRDGEATWARILTPS